jgi:NADPH2:quinone reductase
MTFSACATVVAAAPDVTGVAVGDRVAWVDQPGGYAEHVAVPAAATVPIPAGVAVETAAAVLLQGMTAHYLVHDTYPVRPGDTVLVRAAAGGMGQLLTQLARLRGARVIGTVSSAAKERLARAAGADEVIRYDDTDVAAAVRELTGGEGVAAVYDGVGAPTFDAGLVLQPGVATLAGLAR